MFIAESNPLTSGIPNPGSDEYSRFPPFPAVTKASF